MCFGISLILGGMFFARGCARYEFTTLIDPFEARFGAGWAAVLFVPAMLAEVFWSAELLVAIGSTFGVMLDMNLDDGDPDLGGGRHAVHAGSAGMWAVAYTDAVQLGLVAVGLAVALPLALAQSGGLGHVWDVYSDGAGRRGGVLPLHESALWTPAALVGVVGRQHDADARRHAVELLLPARAVLPSRRGDAQWHSICSPAC